MQLAEYYNFRATLSEMLRDQLVCGIAKQQCQIRLLAEDGLTYDKAVKLLLLMESADQEVRDLSSGLKQVNRLSCGKPSPARLPQRSKGAPICYLCHTATNCPFKDAVCHFCCKEGHIAASARPSRSDRRKENPLSQDLGHLQVWGHLQAQKHIKSQKLSPSPDHVRNTISITFLIPRVTHFSLSTLESIKCHHALKWIQVHCIVYHQSGNILFPVAENATSTFEGD